MASRTASRIRRAMPISLQLILANEELDLSMRQADVAIRLQKPTQPDLIQRRPFTVHFHIYAARDYLDRFGEPSSLEDLDNHRIITFGVPVPSYFATSTGWRSPDGLAGAHGSR